MLIQTAGHDGNIISGGQNILIATSCCQTPGILEIWKYSEPGLRSPGLMECSSYQLDANLSHEGLPCQDDI